MKKFNTSWKASKRPGKQRKYAANAPLHLKRNLMSVNLSKELRKRHGKRNIPLRKGDVVKIMRGKFKKKAGKITAINNKRLRVEIEGIQVKKQDGSKANVRFYPSILQITELNTEDKKRIKGIKQESKKIEEKGENKK
jgi:large subunit ribosomal protein L24